MNKYFAVGLFFNILGWILMFVSPYIALNLTVLIGGPTISWIILPGIVLLLKRRRRVKASKS